jgi:hypothetical protein
MTVGTIPFPPPGAAKRDPPPFLAPGSMLPRGARRGARLLRCHLARAYASDPAAGSPAPGATAAGAAAAGPAARGAAGHENALLARYAALLARGELLPDARQAAVVSRLAGLLDQLRGYAAAMRGYQAELEAFNVGAAAGARREWQGAGLAAVLQCRTAPRHGRRPGALKARRGGA